MQLLAMCSRQSLGGGGGGGGGGVRGLKSVGGVCEGTLMDAGK